MTFPATKRLWGFLWRVPVGWEDLGKCQSVYSHQVTGGYITTTPGCALCKTPARIARDADGTRFRYCPKCLTKLTNGQ